MNKFRPKKKLGQNFLIDNVYADKIIEVADVEGKEVLEVGPGTGVLTFRLASIAKKLIAVELDTILFENLTKHLKGKNNVILINNDILKVDLDKLFENKFSVVANLPYYITSPIIMKLLKYQGKIDKIVVMVQEEVARRIVAKPGIKDYGVLSIAVQYYSDPEIVLKVSKEHFWPIPKVDSAVVKLNVRSRPVVDVDTDMFFRVVKAAFAERRKTLLNALYGGNLGKNREAIKNILESCGIDQQRRGETLSIEEFARLTRAFI